MIETLIEIIKVVSLVFILSFLIRLLYEFTIGSYIRTKKLKDINKMREELIDKLNEELKKEKTPKSNGKPTKPKDE